MVEEIPESYFLMCSACYTPCPSVDAHVVPRWNPERRNIFTTYRCGNCWLTSLDELRTAVSSGESEILASFCEFLVRQGYSKDANMIRTTSSQQQQVYLLKIVDAVQAKKVIFHP